MLSYLGHLALLVLLCCAPPINGSWSQSEPTPGTKEISSAPEGSQFNPELQTLLKKLESIEAAIRASNTEDNTENKYKEIEISERDLEAQEIMAISSILMVLVTIITVYFIFRTLYYTRKAAIHTEEMIDKTKESIEVTKKIGEKQIQAYISTQKSSLHIYPFPYIKLTLRNSGQSPAINLRLTLSATRFQTLDASSPDAPLDFISVTHVDNRNFMVMFSDISSNDSIEVDIKLFTQISHAEEKGKIAQKISENHRFSVDFYGIIEWENVMGQNDFIPLWIKFGELREGDENTIRLVQEGTKQINGIMTPFENKESGKIIVRNFSDMLAK
ncbi:hypothetical protein [Stappia sp. WLB 29]|uniref:hypothetical protein n=1 Tax=Stappia sp. WLB 29 TaxID=2925220 RepID=UPI0020C153FE|nr:hypothetical protein [Stappia sp. WLB 29]